MYVYKRITFIFIIILHISNGTKIVFSNKRPICKKYMHILLWKIENIEKKIGNESC